MMTTRDRDKNPFDISNVTDYRPEDSPDFLGPIIEAVKTPPEGTNLEEALSEPVSEEEAKARAFEKAHSFLAEKCRDVQHEVNNPLAGIFGYIHIFSGLGVEKRITDSLFDNGQRISSLIETILNMRQSRESYEQMLEIASPDVAQKIIERRYNSFRRLCVMASHEAVVYAKTLDHYLSKISGVEDIKEEVAMLRECTERIKNVFIDFQVFAEIGYSDPKIEAIDLNDIVRGSVSRYFGLMDRKKISHSMTLYPGELKVEASKFGLKQIADNYARNAIDSVSERYGLENPSQDLGYSALETPAHISFLTMVLDGSAVLAVTDNGTGLTPENEARAFERSFSTKSTGMGVGLAICKDIAERHSGQVFLYRNPDGDGATAMLAIPLYDKEK